MTYLLEQIKLVSILDVDDELKEKVRTWRNEDRIRKCMLTQHTISSQEHQKWLGQLANSSTQKLWVVFLDDIPFGIVSLGNIDAVRRTSEWGFYIGDESFLGRGLGRKMICKLLMLYFDSMKYDELITKVLSANLKVIDLYVQFRFRQTGTEKYSENENVLTYSFSADDWNRYRKELVNACN
jgi:UDP-4-amino-4,6-dideoxy-N-acetyl-beta-L-altrosamine N-acetyltransferase